MDSFAEGTKFECSCRGMISDGVCQPKFAIGGKKWRRFMTRKTFDVVKMWKDEEK